jgi:predicted lipid-binding transport protein (Tim44 family)
VSEQQPSADQEPEQPAPAPAPGPAPAPASAPAPVRLRRAPRYRAFVLTGAFLGALAGIVASLLLGDPDSLFSTTTTTGYLAAIGLLLGGLLGGTVAVLADRPRR